MRDLVGQRYTQQRYGIGRGGQLCEQPEEIFGVQLTALEVSCDVKTADDIFCKEGGVDSLRLHLLVRDRPPVFLRRGDCIYLSFICRGDEIFPKLVLQIE